MPVDDREKQFESQIEAHLLDNGYSKAERKNCDRERAIDPTVFVPFIQNTQSGKRKARDAHK